MNKRGQSAKEAFVGIEGAFPRNTPPGVQQNSRRASQKARRLFRGSARSRIRRCSGAVSAGQTVRQPFSRLEDVYKRQVTGSTAVYGNAVKNGAEIAIAEINALGGQQYEMKFEDDENDAEKAINAYNSLKDWGMQILMGTVTSNPCIAVAAETANDNMFQLTPSGSAEGCIANDNAFRVCFSDPEQGTLCLLYTSYFHSCWGYIHFAEQY